MKRTSLSITALLLGLLLFLAGCTPPQEEVVAKAEPLGAADWMTIDMGWIPQPDYTGVQIMEIRRQSETRLEIAHVPVTGIPSLDEGLASDARARMDRFEAEVAASESPMRYMLECAVTQNVNGVLSVILAEQTTPRQSQGLAPVISCASYNKATGLAMDPMAGLELTAEEKERLSQGMRSALPTGSGLTGAEDWLTQALAETGSGWRTAIVQKDGVALMVDKPEGGVLPLVLTPEAIEAARKALAPVELTGKLIALTFDDGPHKENTPRLLDILDQYNVKCTFFMQGQNVKSNPDVVKMVHDRGHEIGNHSYDHPNLTKISIDEVYDQLNKTDDLIESACGVRTQIMRPPYGSTTYALRDQLSMPVIKWHVDGMDSYTKDPDEIVDAILTETRDGDIILLHDTHSFSVDAVPRVIEKLQAKGFTFVTVSQLLTRNGETLKGGEAYQYCKPAN